MLSKEYDYEVMTDEHDGSITTEEVPDTEKKRAQKLSDFREAKLVEGEARGEGVRRPWRRPVLRGRHRPRLSDLRATGSMEQDADVVIFAHRPDHRPEMYGIDIDANGNSTDGIAELLVKKNRNGETGTAVTVFKEEHTNFYDLEPGHDRRAATPDDEAPF